MLPGVQVDEILKLDAEDRLRLLELIWDSLAADTERVAVTDAQRRVLEERLAEHEASPDEVVSWDELKAQLRLR